MGNFGQSLREEEKKKKEVAMKAVAERKELQLARSDRASTFAFPSGWASWASYPMCPCPFLKAKFLPCLFHVARVHMGWISSGSLRLVHRRVTLNKMMRKRPQFKFQQSRPVNYARRLERLMFFTLHSANSKLGRFIFQ